MATSTADGCVFLGNISNGILETFSTLQHFLTPTFHVASRQKGLYCVIRESHEGIEMILLVMSMSFGILHVHKAKYCTLLRGLHGSSESILCQKMWLSVRD